MISSHMHCSAEAFPEVYLSSPIPVMTNWVPPAVLPATALMPVTLALALTDAGTYPQPIAGKHTHKLYDAAGMSGLRMQVTVSE